MISQDKARKFLGAVTKAIEEGHGQSAYQVGDAAIDLVCDGFLEAIESAGVCRGCKDKIGLTLKPLVELLDNLKGPATPRPMCKETPEAIALPCPSCGTMTRRVDPDPLGILGSDLGRPKFVCPKCSPEKCARCKGKGWTKGVTPGGSRVARVKCYECHGTGAR